MTSLEWWLAQSSEFKSGYEACCRCELYDIAQSEEWKKGWVCASETMEN